MVRQISALLLVCWALAASAGAEEKPIDVREILREALEAAKALGTEEGLALDGIPSALARAGDVKAALEVAATMDGSHHELERIAITQAKARHIKGAVQTANSIVSVAGKDRALAQIAGVQADGGDLQGARKTSEPILDPGSKAWV